jgi:hypothetical protein
MRAGPGEINQIIRVTLSLITHYCVLVAEGERCASSLPAAAVLCTRTNPCAAVLLNGATDHEAGRLTHVGLTSNAAVYAGVREFVR